MGEWKIELGRADAEAFALFVEPLSDCESQYNLRR
jgi:hypothetical protein